MVVIRGRKLLARSYQGLIAYLKDGTNPLGIVRMANGKNNELKSGLMPRLF